MTLTQIEQHLKADGVVFKYTKHAPSTPWHCLNRVNDRNIYRVAYSGDGWQMLVSELPNPTTKKHTRAVLMGESQLYWLI